MPLDPNQVSFKRAYEKTLITDPLNTDEVLLFRGTDEASYNVYRLTFERLLELASGGGGGGTSLFLGVFTTLLELSLASPVAGNTAIVYDETDINIAPQMFVWSTTDTQWVLIKGTEKFIGNYSSIIQLPEGNTGEYATIQSPEFRVCYWSNGTESWELPEARNRFHGIYASEEELPSDPDEVLYNDFASVEVLYNDFASVSQVLYRAAGLVEGVVSWEPIAGIRDSNDEQGFTREQLILTKPVNSGGEQYTDSLLTYDHFTLFGFSSSVPCRIRLYNAAVYQDNDLDRTDTTPATGNHGCFFDSSLGIGNVENINVAPAVTFVCDYLENRIFYTIDTLGGGDIAVEVQLDIIPISNNVYSNQT